MIEKPLKRWRLAVYEGRPSDEAVERGILFFFRRHEWNYGVASLPVCAHVLHIFEILCMAAVYSSSVATGCSEIHMCL